MPTLEWAYHRNGCKTCAKAQDFLLRHKLKPALVTDARKTRMSKEEVLQLAQQVEQIYATKGSKIIHLDMKAAKANSSLLTELLIGPTGNLRAPTLKAGKVLLVGFDEGVYKKVFGKQELS